MPKYKLLETQKPFPYRNNFNCFTVHLQRPFCISGNNQQFVAFQYFGNFQQGFYFPVKRPVAVIEVVANLNGCAIIWNVEVNFKF